MSNYAERLLELEFYAKQANTKIKHLNGLVEIAYEQFLNLEIQADSLRRLISAEMASRFLRIPSPAPSL